MEVGGEGLFLDLICRHDGLSWIVWNSSRYRGAFWGANGRVTQESHGKMGEMHSQKRVLNPFFGKKDDPNTVSEVFHRV